MSKQRSLILTGAVSLLALGGYASFATGQVHQRSLTEVTQECEIDHEFDPEACLVAEPTGVTGRAGSGAHGRDSLGEQGGGGASNGGTTSGGTSSGGTSSGGASSGGASRDRKSVV